jgi:sulfatase maturation enzyme AslB (radical SAM superfamily)
MRHLEITTKLCCDVNCQYCPQKTLKEAYDGPEYFAMDTFRKVLNNVPNSVDIHFSGFCEPFLSSDCVDMIKASSSHKISLFTTLVGLREDVFEELKDFKFKRVTIHLLNQGSLALLEKYVEKGGFRTPHFDVMCIGGKLESDIVKIRSIPAHSRAGNNEIIINKKGKIACSKSKNLWQNVVLPNGDVYMCCCDYGLTCKMGSLLEMTWGELDRQTYIDMQRNGGGIICQNCEFAR